MILMNYLISGCQQIRYIAHWGRYCTNSLSLSDMVIIIIIILQVVITTAPGCLTQAGPLSAHITSLVACGRVVV